MVPESGKRGSGVDKDPGGVSPLQVLDFVENMKPWKGLEWNLEYGRKEDDLRGDPINYLSSRSARRSA